MGTTVECGIEHSTMKFTPLPGKIEPNRCCAYFTAMNYMERA